ncbi:MAG: hypothetical protein ACM3WP_24060, partial [Acidobacteriota bacterium]
MAETQPPEQLSVQQFAARLRTRFPGPYDDLPDDVLVDKTLEHYPQYKDMLAPAEPRAEIRAWQPSQWERLKSAVPSIGHIADIVTGNKPAMAPMQPQDVTQLAYPERVYSPAEREAHPIRTGFDEFAGALTSPDNLLLMQGLGAAGMAPAAIGKALPRLASGYFAFEMGKGGYAGGKAALEAWNQYKQTGDERFKNEAMRLGTHALLSTGMAWLSGKHAATGEAAPQSEPAPEAPEAPPESKPALPWLRRKAPPTEPTAPPQPAATTQMPAEAATPAPAPPTPTVANSAPARAGSYGAESVVKTPSADIPARYKVVEASELIPSHDPETFQPAMQYPPGIQERAYHVSKEAQQRVIEQSQNYDPRYTVNTNPDAVNGPPIVNPDGFVLGGNSRTMSTQRIYSRGQGENYRAYLRANAEQFGLDPNAIDRMENPVLVREVSSPPDTESARRLASELNKSMTGALGVSERAVSAGKSITPESLKALSGMLDQLGPDSSIRDLLRDRGAEVLKILTKDGAITDRERPQFIDTSTGGLSEEGKTFAERALLGTVVDDPTLMERAPKFVLNKLDGSLADIAAIAPRHDEYNLVPLIREAIHEHAEVVAHGSNLETHLAQAGMFGPDRNPAVDAIVRKLAQKPKEVRAAFRNFAQDANADQPGQGFLAMGEQPSAATAFNRAFGTKFSDAEYEQLVMQSLHREA